MFPGEEHVEEMETDFVLQDTQANFSTKNFQKIFSDKILDLIMLFHGRQNVPYSATLEFVTCMKSFTDLLVGELKSLLNDFNSHDNIAGALSSVSTVFDSLKTKYRIRKVYENYS